MTAISAEPQMNERLQRLLDQLGDGLLDLLSDLGPAEASKLERLLDLLHQAETLAFDAPPSQTSCPRNDPNCPNSQG